MSAGGDVPSEGEVNPEVSETDISMRELRAECEHTWRQVKEVQGQLDETRQPPRGAVSGSQPPLVAILREKERLLRAEIEVVKRMEPQTPPKNIQVVEGMLMEELQHKVYQLRETLSLVESQSQDLQACLHRERAYEQQLTDVTRKLQEKCDGVEGEAPPEDAVEVVAQELEAKINQARHTKHTVMKRMAAFVGKHFPVPEPAQVVKLSKDLRSRKQQSNKETLPLKDILLELMTKCVESPSDPYLQLTEQHWPAYIELLLRCNIILQHPDDDRRVKLVPFHL